MIKNIAKKWGNGINKQEKKISNNKKNLIKTDILEKKSYQIKEEKNLKIEEF